MRETSSLLDISRAVARGWLVILLSIVVCVSGAFAVKHALPEKYEATAVLTVEPLTISPGSGGTVDMETERVVASSTSVLSGAAEALGESLGDVQDAVVVTIPKGSRILEFTFTSSSPQQASDGANAVAQAYSDQRTASAQTAVDDTIETQSRKIAELEQQLAGEQSGSVSARAVELQISSLQERQAALTAATFYPGTLVSPATPPSRASGFGTVIYLAAGFALGALIGFFLALIRERLRWERRSESQAKHLAPESWDPSPTQGELPLASTPAQEGSGGRPLPAGTNSRRADQPPVIGLDDPSVGGPAIYMNETAKTQASLRLGPRRSVTQSPVESDLGFVAH